MDDLQAARVTLAALGAKPCVFVGPMGNRDIEVLTFYEKARVRMLLRLMAEQMDAV